MHNEEKLKVNVVGATGLVGQTLLNIFKEENFYPAQLNLYTSEKSKGRKINFHNNEIILKSAEKDFPFPADFTFLMTDKSQSLQYAKKFFNSQIIIDNSSAFRLIDSVPLIVPEINGEEIGEKKLIANPNCTTAICAIPLSILKEEYGISRVNATTFQSVSGCGRDGIEAFLSQNANGFYSHDISKTCIPKIGETAQNKYTEEELKMQDELRKILNDYALRISATCVRVPIQNCHSVNVSVTTKKPFSVEKIKWLFSQNEHLEICDDTNQNIFPNAIQANGTNKVYVGRIRCDLSLDNTLLFYLTSDNLRRGAAYNAFEIMRWIIKNKL